MPQPSRRAFLGSLTALALPRVASAQPLLRPTWHPVPVLVPQADEYGCAMPFSDGCWFDEARQRYRLWYMAGYNAATGLAESRDGYEWERYGLVDTAGRDSSTVWPDGEGGYVRATYLTAEPHALTLYRSPDGIQWRRIGRSVACGDRSTIYRLKDGRWVLSARDGTSILRTRRYYVADAWGEPWTPIDSTLTAVDPPAQLYNVDVSPFQDGYLAFATVWHGDHQDRAKDNDIALYTGADGLSWTLAESGWIQPPYGYLTGNVQTCAGGPVRLSDGKLGLYVSVRSMPKICCTGLVILA